MQFLRNMSGAIALAGLVVTAGCQPAEPDPASPLPQASLAYDQPEGAEIVVLDTRLATEVFAEGAQVEKLTEDLFGWSEGPVWIRDGGYLLFTDVPGNTIHKWSDETGLETFLQPSGLVGEDTEGVFREPGSTSRRKRRPSWRHISTASAFQAPMTSCWPKRARYILPIPLMA